MSDNVVMTSSPMQSLGLPEPPMPNNLPGPEDRDEYLIGTVAVTTIFPESNGAMDPDTETWNALRMDKVYSEIYDGLDWWESQMPNGRLEFTVYTLGQQSTRYEPITRSSTNQPLWVGEILTNLGYSSGDYLQDVMDLNNDVRNTYGKDWAYTAFIVDSYVDFDGTFTDGVSGYAYGMGGPFMVMTYDNNGWGVSNMDKVMAHETGHMFYATDEYTRPGEWSGYLNILEVDGSGCIMDSASWCLSSGTLGQIGWRDSDGDGIMDPEDTIPNTILDPQPLDPTTNNVLTYTGRAEEVALNNQNPFYSSWLEGHRVNAGNDVSINTITMVQYRVDGGTWYMATAVDGAYDEEIEDFTFTTSALPDGTYMIEVRARNTVGNWDDALSSDVITVDTTPPTTTASIAGTMGTNGWYTSDVMVTLLASDATSGIQYTRYKLNGGGWQIYVGPFPVNGDGMTALEYYSVDNVDIVEGTSNRDIKIDKADPSTTESMTGTVGNNGYYTSSVMITLSASDLVSGVHETRYNIDGGVWLTYAGSFQLGGDWIYSIRYYSVDVAGKLESTSSFSVKIDTTSPATGHTISGPLGSNSWYISTVTVTLDPIDLGSGVEGTKYRVDGGNLVDYVGPFQIFGNGLHDFEYFSSDHAGNVESLSTAQLKIDAEMPSTDSTPTGTLGTNGWYTGNVTFDLAGSDSVSGVAFIQYRVDTGPWLTYVGSFKIVGEGLHTIEYCSVDNAGNTEAVQTVQVSIDTLDPSTSGDVSGTSGSGGWFRSDVTIMLTGTDASSGVQRTLYRVDGGTWMTYVGSFSIATDGTYTVEFYSVDNASNAETTTSITVKIDSVAPSTGETVSGVIGDNAWYTGDVSIALVGSDSTSGVQYTKYRINGGSWQDYPGSIALTRDGAFTVEYYSSDTAGNVEGTMMLDIKIDMTDPNLDSLSIDDLDGEGTLTTSIATVRWTGSDAMSGIDHYEVGIDGGGPSNVGLQFTKTFTNLKDGSHTVTVKAVDKAGNSWVSTMGFAKGTDQLGSSGLADVFLYVLIIILTTIFVLALLLWKRKKDLEPEER
jgi:hypothetical protein